MKATKTLLIAAALTQFLNCKGFAQEKYAVQSLPIPTRWTKQVGTQNVLNQYPRPQLVRQNWTNLNGLWDCSITPKDGDPQSYDGKILVPYPVESALSGVKKSLLPEQNLWYRRQIIKPVVKSNEKILLHFDAVDFEATVFVNEKEVSKHTGGYQHFTIDVTGALKPGNNELKVKVWDPTDQGPNPHGKQSLNPANIFYTPSSGIWQTVWLEVVPQEYISGLKITPDVDHKQVKVVVYGLANKPVTIMAAGKTVKGLANKEIILPLANARLWSPDDPYLYDLTATLGSDKVKSYFGMRKIEVKKDKHGIDKIFLNGKYTYNLGTLDQGFWPDGLHTAPTDEALQFDIKAIKAMGFNTIRKHIKIEPDRWYYWTDKLGMLVWQDMVQPGSDNEEGHVEFEKESKADIEQLFNHPSITTWVLFNEKWGQYDQARLTKWMKETDPTRLVNGHSGEYLYVNHQLRSPSPDAYVNADITDVHAYPYPMMPVKQAGKAMVCGEFGGIGVSIEGHLFDDTKAGWGYDGTVNPATMRKQYTQMIDTLVDLQKRGLGASIYTQPVDVETEQNGLMTYDREIVKLPFATIRGINSKLWPATKNYQITTQNIIARVAEPVSKDYVAKLAEYNAGNHKSEFLRSLALMARAQKDNDNALKIGNEYIDIIKDQPLSDDNIRFAELFTTKSTDSGFPMLLNYLKDHDGVTSARQTSFIVQLIIYKEQVKPILTKNPDWSAVDNTIKKYPQLNGEFVIGSAVMNYLGAVVQKQENATKNLVDVASIYDSHYQGAAYNDWAWTLFLNSNDKTELSKALAWSEKSIERAAPNEVNMCTDTYANLLYKLGRKEEAIIWESKALAAEPHNGDFIITLDKMKKGEPTWPQN